LPKLAQSNKVQCGTVAVIVKLGKRETHSLHYGDGLIMRCVKAPVRASPRMSG
jgi:hypothetical protein